MSTILPIESSANPKLKRWRKIAREARAMRREGSTLVEGLHLLEVVLEALDNPNRSQRPDVRAVMISEHATDEAGELAMRLAERAGVRVYGLLGALYDELSPVEHGAGCMCEIALPTENAVENPDDAAPWTDDLLYLDGVQDAGNAGTLVRTAVAAGVRTIVASPKTAQLWSPKVLRAGMGAHFGARIIENVTAEALRSRFKGRILAADARGGEDLFAADDYTAAGPVCWVMGAEGPGVSEEVLAVADARYYIPIEKACESLNVGAAAAVCLFDARRRRLTRGAL